jgi:hypothetical protein
MKIKIAGFAVPFDRTKLYNGKSRTPGKGMTAAHELECHDKNTGG